MTEQAKKQDASMDEILSSIRSIVNEEMDKKAESIQDDVLELTEEIDENVATSDLGVTSAIADAPEHQLEDDLIDINAFSQDGSMKLADIDAVSAARDHYNAELTGSEAETTEQMQDEAAQALEALESTTEEIPTTIQTEESSDDALDIDALMASGSTEMPVADVTSEVDMPTETTEEAFSIDEMMAEATAESIESVEENTEEQAVLSDEDLSDLEEDVVDDFTADEEEDLSTAATEALIQKAVAASNQPRTTNSVQMGSAEKRINLKAIPSANASLQIGFPLEVLAEALRPLVKDWVEENLQEVVERLVREEIQKMTNR